MNIVKLYNAEGKHVESFKIAGERDAFIMFNGRKISKNKAIKLINSKGLYLKKQLASIKNSSKQPEGEANA